MKSVPSFERVAVLYFYAKGYSPFAHFSYSQSIYKCPSRPNKEKSYLKNICAYIRFPLWIKIKRKNDIKVIPINIRVPCASAHNKYFAKVTFSV